MRDYDDIPHHLLGISLFMHFRSYRTSDGEITQRGRGAVIARTGITGPRVPGGGDDRNLDDTNGVMNVREGEKITLQLVE